MFLIWRDSDKDRFVAIMLLAWVLFQLSDLSPTASPRESRIPRTPLKERYLISRYLRHHLLKPFLLLVSTNLEHPPVQKCKYTAKQVQRGTGWSLSNSSTTLLEFWIKLSFSNAITIYSCRNAIQYTTTQCNAIQYNTMQFNAIQHNTFLLFPRISKRQFTQPRIAIANLGRF